MVEVDQGAVRDHAYVAKPSTGEVMLGVDEHEAWHKIQETKKWFARCVQSE